ncbi:MAG: Amidase [Burkholderiales bacterium]|jgi:aspartyl-tRNA(Asn)/glutamyl-tRNA(Gln) amidotransferase subunit A|nr:Amidase [Burkholderiales bacterium]
MYKNFIKLINSLVFIAATNLYAFDMDKFLATYPTIEQIHNGLALHRFTCTDLINGYIKRIKTYNLTTTNNTPPLNAITRINSLALADAAKIDKETSLIKMTGPLLCIPVIIKDHIDVQNLPTSSGSLTLLGTYPLKDSKITQYIRNSGGIILAKSAMDELASGMFGMSSLSGRIGNAYKPDYNPGGSSGGSAVSVAAGFSPLAIGSDNSGSVRIPAFFNGIYGLRPTYGLINSDGIFPLGNLDGTAGPMANNVVDLARLLTIITGSKIQYYKSLHKDSLKGKHFAIIKNVAGISLWKNMPKPILDIYNQALNNLKQQGADITSIDLPKYSLKRKYNMAGTTEAINKYLMNNISTLGKFQNICNLQTRIYGDKNNCLKLINLIKSSQDPEYKNVVKTINNNQQYILAIMKKYNLDGLIIPSSKKGIANYNGDNIANQMLISSNSGLPEITIPIAQFSGLPVGIEILGTSFAEEKLLNYAYAYEQAYYSFHPPKLTSSTKMELWDINKLNLLYMLIGHLAFEKIIKPANKTYISPEQFTPIVNEAIDKIQDDV